jgi:hypothetical protein
MICACISLVLTVDRLGDAQRQIVGSGFNQTPEYKNIMEEWNKKEDALRQRLASSKDTTSFELYSFRIDRRDAILDEKIHLLTIIEARLIRLPLTHF